jgi:hypothetical protein
VAHAALRVALLGGDGVLLRFLGVGCRLIVGLPSVKFPLVALNDRARWSDGDAKAVDQEDRESCDDDPGESRIDKCKKIGPPATNTLFDGIANNPAASEYWWAYALLLSSMIPSLINLAIGGMALTRGVPGVGRLLLNWIPEGRVPDYRRPLAALGLTVQMFSGAVLGIAAQALLFAWGLLFHLMPAVGLDLLWLCQKLADLDLPAKFFRLTGIAGVGSGSV